jgi:Flp pilus assembly protein TadG
MIGLTMTTKLKAIIAKLRAFARSKRGNVAMMFAIAMVPLVIAAGAGLDFARAMLVRQQMAGALDAAGLAVGSSTGLDQTSAQALAQKFFDANYTVDKTAFGTPTVSIPTSGYNSGGSVLITASAPMPTILMKLAGITSLPITASTTVVWGQSKLWVSLVLDNSGSMAQGDSTGSKMNALQNASHQLLTILQGAASTAGDVKVSVIPFDRNINIGNSNVNAAWIDWTDWEAPPAAPGTNYTYGTVNQYSSNPSTVSFEAWGPGDNCPFTTSSNGRMSPYGFRCNNGPSNSASTVSTIPASGTYTGYICPGQDNGNYGNSAHRARYYNGCYTSTKVTSGTTTVIVSSGSNTATCSGFSNSNCGCNGGGSNKVCKTQRWTHTWVKNAHSTWGGCIMDRDKTYDYDISNTAPSTTPKGFPAVNPSNCLGTATMSLSYDWTALGNKIDAMAPNASTNQAIGMAHGWQSLTNASPYSPGAVPSNTTRYIIILSDGLNTQDRWWGDGSIEGSTEDGYIDARMNKTCSAAKTDGVIVYSIFLHIGTSGNSTPLLNCATDSTKYFDLTSTGAVVTTFQQIAQQITNVRVSK